MKTPGSEHGQVIEDILVNGNIVPTPITSSLLMRAMEVSEKNNFLVDGFPRNNENLRGWNKAIGNKVNLKFVLNIECGQNTSMERCLTRGAEAASAMRSDDNIESLKKRYVTFLNATLPIIKHFDEQDMVRTINGERNVEE